MYIWQEVSKIFLNYSIESKVDVEKRKKLKYNISIERELNNCMSQDTG